MVVVASPTPLQPSRSRAVGAWWRYLERGHAHEVLAQWREREGVLEVRETAPAAPDARLEERMPVARAWEVRVALWTLQCRLSGLGSYWEQRSVDGRWRTLARPAGAPTLDVRPNAVIDPPHAPVVHHYHDERGGGDQLLAAVKAERERFLVLRAQLDVPSLDVGRIDVVHPRLPAPLMRSAVVREQHALHATGMGKLVTRDDYLRAFGSGGEARARRLIDEVVERVRDAQLERPERPLTESALYAEFLLVMNDPRLRALHARYLAPGEEEALLAAGPVAIRKWISQRRQRTEHAAQHLLTLLEASLLAREKMRGGRLTRGDPEIAALAHLAYYL